MRSSLTRISRTVLHPQSPHLQSVLKVSKPLSYNVIHSAPSQPTPSCYHLRFSHRTFITTSTNLLKATDSSSSSSSPQETNHAAQATPLSDSEYHERSDEYMNTLTLALEEMAEDSSKGMEVEYSVSSPTIYFYPNNSPTPRNPPRLPSLQLANI